MSDADEDAALDRLLAVVFDQFHYDFRGYARASLHRRVANAVDRLGVPSIGALADRLLEDRAAFAELLSWFTIQLSDLFRDPAYFRRFREDIVPWLRTYPSRKLWVAGCSTGEEAYSLAIVLREEGLLDRSLIYATDIYPDSLRTAQAGVYDLDRMRGFSQNYLAAGGTGSLSDHYATDAHGAMFDRSLREHIVFADHSLATDAVFAEVQVVSCRNVLIYFAPQLQERALGLFHEALVRGGWLGLGPRETLDFTSYKARFTAHPERWFHKQEAR